MKRNRALATLVAVALVGFYGYRAVTGVTAGIAWARGIKMILTREYEDAIPQFERAAVGVHRFSAQRRAADARIDVWELQARKGGPLGAETELLGATAIDYLGSLCAAPAARNPWEGLGLVYQKLEWIGREQRSEIGFVAGEEPWSRVGRAGRITIGMMRRAAAAAPHWYLHYDWLVEMFWNFGLETETRIAIRDAARALPLYFLHEFAEEESLPDWTLDEFFVASRDLVGNAPLLPRAGHLVDLGKQALRRRSYDEAVEVLTEALEFPGDAVNRADNRFQLGLALIGQGREQEGEEQLRLAAEHPAFRLAARLNLAWAAERAGNYVAALSHVAELRRQDPRNVDYCLRAADLARRLEDWPAALEALQWAQVVEPDDPQLQVVLIAIYLEMGDLPAARAVLRELEAWAPEAVPEGLRRQLTED